MTVGSSSWTDTHRLVLCFLLFFFTTVSFEAGQFPQKGGAVRLAPDALFNRLSPSVFVVEALDLQGNTISLGSGVALGKDLLVTNEHVISEAVGIRVWHDDRQWMAIEKIPHRTQDLTLLSVANLNATGVSLREGETRIGERVYAIGSPEGLELTLSDGLISGIRELTPGTLSIQTSASISHGSSGGGLFDEYGRLIGITTLTLTDGQNLNFAIPASFVRDLVRPSQHIDAKLPDVAIRLQEEWDIASKQINRTSNPADIEKFTILSQGLLQFMPEEAGILDAVADIYHLRKDFQNAIKYYEKSLSVDPGNEISWSKLAFSLDRKSVV